jgi:hypothetical protein
MIREMNTKLDLRNLNAFRYFRMHESTRDICNYFFDDQQRKI